MSSKAPLVSTTSSCSLCVYARYVGNPACAVCLPPASPLASPSESPSVLAPIKHALEPSHYKIQLYRHHVRASVLHYIKANARTDKEFRAGLGSLVETTERRELYPTNRDHAGVVLAEGSVTDKVLAIWLEAAEDAAPTMDLVTWTTLGSPTWKDNEVFVCTEFDAGPKHRRSSECYKCTQAAWLNSGARMMLGGISEQEERDLQRMYDWQTVKCKRSGTKSAFRRFRKSFTSQDPRQRSIWD